MNCLLNEQCMAFVNGDVIDFAVVTGNAGIVQARNQLASQFMDSECDRLIFLDADVTFEPGALVKLAHRPEDVVGGAYRYKQDQESYPMMWLPDPEKKGLWYTNGGLIEVMAIPTGFMSISRACLEAFQAKWPERVQTHADHKSFTYFQMPFVSGSHYGEDYYFCKEWREELGGKVYLDPHIKLTHWGFNPTPFAGDIAHWLKNQPTTAPDTVAVSEVS
jgi:glycosyltransferase involved in cell wall biosynthesis